MNTDTIELRPIAAGDRDAWGTLWSAYLDFYRISLPPAVHDTAFASLLSRDPASFDGRLAWRGDEALGLVHWVFHPNLWRPEGVCYLQDLFTVPAARGRGIARRLIEAVYAAADRRGAPRVYWLTQEFNYAGRMLYDRIGRKTAFIRYDRPV
ncbi:GNAT family N-acetyltransferase [Jannaschia sp. S6380]|uniref:GNAT family N-acetyltransferase n=1 Tax=Jannaschia sp. S6380 TaxID=2926408 RepID=UPI001FF5EB80|nr:GNAT family N-acetyltransferase [Jannaschia sp. S6380]MCK0167366.1 GNAT family N-acetyltransferase [Jannaschia sp. S6380]